MKTGCQLWIIVYTHDEPYSMWRRASTCLPWRTIPADMPRVDNTEHTKPILFCAFDIVDKQIKDHILRGCYASSSTDYCYVSHLETTIT